MKQIVLLLWTVTLLFAQQQTDIALTAGYNRFHDPSFLRRSKIFYGIRAGTYIQKETMLQLGYSYARNCNCKGLTLQRLFVNALRFAPQPTPGIKPYAIATAGYEISSIHAHKPNQLFLGIGGGLRFALTPPMDAFLETRVLKKLQTGDHDLITTLGIAYNFQTPTTVETIVPTSVPAPELYESSVEVVMPESVIAEQTPVPVTTEAVKPTLQSKHYYVQLAALTKTDPKPLLRKLRRKGFHAKVKHIVKAGKKLTLVVTGPYTTRAQARKRLYRLRKIVPDAFIVKR